MSVTPSTLTGAPKPTVDGVSPSPQSGPAVDVRLKMPTPLTQNSSGGSAALPPIEIVLPSGQLSGDPEEDLKLPRRRYAFVGELLKFYVVVGVPRGEAHGSKQLNSESLEGFDLDVSLIADNNNDEPGASGGKSSTKRVSSKASDGVLDTPLNQHESAFCSSLDEEILVPPSDVDLNGSGCFRRKSVSTGRRVRKCVELQNGCYAYPLEVLLWVKKKYLDGPLALVVSVSTKNFGDNDIGSNEQRAGSVETGVAATPTGMGPSGPWSGHDHVLNQLYKESRYFQTHIVEKKLKHGLRVVQPLSISSRAVAVKRKHIIAMLVENTHPTVEITLQAAQLHLGSTDELVVHKSRKEMFRLRGDFAQLFNAFVDSTVFPVVLKPQEVASITVQMMMSGDPGSAHLQGEFRTPITLEWTSSAAHSRVIYRHYVRYSLKLQEPVSIQIQCPSPVQICSQFEADLTIVVAEGQHEFDLEVETLFSDGSRSRTGLELDTSDIDGAHRMYKPVLVSEWKRRRIGALTEGSVLCPSVSFIALSEGVFDIAKCISCVDVRTGEVFFPASSCKIYAVSNLHKK